MGSGTVCVPSRPWGVEGISWFSCHMSAVCVSRPCGPFDSTLADFRGSNECHGFHPVPDYWDPAPELWSMGGSLRTSAQDTGSCVTVSYTHLTLPTKRIV